MATVLNKRDVALQAASPRTATVNLGSTVTVNGNVTGTLDGTSVTTVVNAALNATANYFTTSTSDPTGGANGDAHFNSATNVMWFKVAGAWTRGGTVSASEITTGTLAAARIAANSITASKLSVSSLSAIAADLGSVTTGNISGTANIDITGTGRFNGATSQAGVNNAIVANNSRNQLNGVLAYDGTATGGVSVGAVSASTNGIGVETSASGSGGKGITASAGSGTGATGVGVEAIAFGSATALSVLGPMTITSSALVSNLRSATCLLADNSTKWNGFSQSGTSTGSSTATLVLTNKPGSNSTNGWLTVTNGTTTIRWPVWT